MHVFTSSPNVRVTFFVELPKFTSRQISIDTTQRDSLIEVTTHKDLSTPAGTFTVVMSPTNKGEGWRWQDVLRVGDLVVIEMGPDKPQPKTWYERQMSGLSGQTEIVMIGSIDAIRETIVTGQDGKPQSAITLRGRDFAKYLVDDAIFWESWSDPSRANIGLAPEIDQWMKSKYSGLPAGLMRFLLQFLASRFDVRFDTGRNRQPSVRIPSPGTVYTMIRSALTTATPEIAGAYGLEAARGAPWSVLERAVGSPHYQLVLDVRRKRDVTRIMDGTGEHMLDSDPGDPGINTTMGTWESQIALLYYRNPWSNRFYDDWTSLPTRVITDADVIASDLGVGIEDISNLWRVVPEWSGAFRPGDKGLASKLPAQDQNSQRRFGMRPLIVASPFTSGQATADNLTVMENHSLMLRDWNCLNDVLLSGRVTMKGMAAVKVGDRLWWQGEEQTSGSDFYVEAVEQSFQAFSGWQTAVSVSMGQKHRERGHLLFDKDGTLTRDPRVWRMEGRPLTIPVNSAGDVGITAR